MNSKPIERSYLLKSITAFILIFFSLSCKQLIKEERTLGKADNIINYDSLSQRLETIYNQDQRYRLQFEEMLGTNRYDADLVRTMKEADSINQTEVIELIDTYGWLPKSKIGEKASDALFFVIQHAEITIIERYFPRLKMAAETGEASLTDAALMEDRLLMYTNRKQKYGTQISSRTLPDGTFEYYVWPIESPENVDSLRLAIGYKTTVEAYAIEMNALYNPNETLK